MKQSFNQFAVRFLTAILAGLFLLLLHGVISGGPLAVFVPRCSSAWELSKLAFWPLLVTLLLTRRVSSLPALVLTPLALLLADWAILSLGGSGSICLALWVAALAVALAFEPKDGKSWIWRGLAVALGIGYVVLTYFVPQWGPFLCPGDVAAMATIPF